MSSVWELCALNEALNMCLRKSRSNRKVTLRREANGEVTQVTVYDPDAGMYYAMDYVVETLK